MTPTNKEPVVVSLADLRAGTIPFSSLLSAFGPGSLGILLVRDLPSEFPILRSRVLSEASRLAQLPAQTLAGLTNQKAKYLVGWSHGKEMLRDGVVDSGKGSFYVNCAEFGRRGRDDGGAEKEVDEDEAKRRWPGFDEYTAPNIWPAEAAMPGFRDDAQDLITMIVDVAILVARACDQYAAEAVEGYPRGCLEEVVRTSRTTKARLLHYFPAAAEAARIRQADEGGEGAADDDWCATHLDHGCLTGLTSAMFVDESAASPCQLDDPATTTRLLLDELPRSPDPSSGLYVCSRDGETIKVSIPRHCLAFQTGEALELMTKGRFKAVPHFVKAVSGSAGRTASSVSNRIARNTLAVFTQPNLGELVDHERGITFGEFARGVVSKNTA